MLAVRLTVSRPFIYCLATQQIQHTSVWTEQRAYGNRQFTLKALLLSLVLRRAVWYSVGSVLVLSWSKGIGNRNDRLWNEMWCEFSSKQMSSKKDCLLNWATPRNTVLTEKLTVSQIQQTLSLFTSNLAVKYHVHNNNLVQTILYQINSISTPTGYLY